LFREKMIFLLLAALVVVLLWLVDAHSTRKAGKPPPVSSFP
jgi:hypothetical protein